MNQQRDLRQELRAMQEARSLKWLDVARSMDVSRSALSQWLNGKYTGDNESIATKVAAFLSLENERDPASRPSFIFVETTIARKVREILREVHREGVIGICVGESGLGKTESVKEYARQVPGVILLEAHHSYSVADVIRDIHRALGGSGRGTIHAMMRDIVEWLKGSRRVIVIDEAEHMKVVALDELRRIHDWTGVGILYVGLPRFRQMLKGRRHDFAYIVNRVRLPADLSHLKPKDTAAIVEAYLPEAAHLAGVFHECCEGVTRDLGTLLYNVTRVEDRDQGGIDAALIRQVSRELKV